ncbi:MAG: energy-coupling factor transporter transmembrane component T [Chloroflexota bacterium]
MIIIQYSPGNTFIHKLHPLNKLLWLLGFSIAVFLVQNAWLSIAITLVLFLLLFYLEKSVLLRIRGFRLALFTSIFLFLLQLIFNNNGPILLNLGVQWLTITRQGLSNGLIIAGRFLSIILVSYLFVLSTSPNALAYALMRIGIPYRFGFILITALRLVPILEDDAKTIYRAQISRGVNIDTKKISKLWNLPRQYFTPVLVSALAKVDALNFSMEGRCFGKFPNRTYLSQAKISPKDIAVICLLTILLVICILY